jgi:hypothetical protein
MLPTKKKIGEKSVGEWEMMGQGWLAFHNPTKPIIAYILW